MRRLLFAFYLLSIPLTVQAATKYAINGGGNWTGSIWNTASNQTTSNTTVPANTDDIILDQYAGPITIDNTTCVAKTVDMTLYTSTLTFTDAKTLTMYSTMTLGGYLSGTGVLAFSVNAGIYGALKSNGITFPGALNVIGANSTFTILDNAIITSTVTFGGTGTGYINSVSGSSITCLGSFTSACNKIGTVNVVLAGTGTFTGSSSYYCQFPIIMNTTQTYTLAAHGFRVKDSTLTYVSGTLGGTGSSRIAMWGKCWLLGPWPTIQSFEFNGASTMTINSNINISGLTYMFPGVVMPADYDFNMNGSVACTNGCSTKLNRSLTMGVLYGLNASNMNAFYGPYDISVSTLIIKAADTWKFPAGQTLTIRNQIMSYASASPDNAPKVISYEDGVNANIQYLGTLQNMQLSHVAFTDITAVGATLYDVWASTLTRTSNITNKDASNFVTATDIVGIQ